MTENLHADLENLRKEVAEKGRAPVILSHAAFEQHFHGLTLGQIVKLTDAPALVTIEEAHMPDGTRMERFSIDGKDPDLCHSVARHFLLDPTTAFLPGIIREVKACDDDVARETMIRDQGVIYRATPYEAVADEPLTRTLQSLRRRGAYSAIDVSSPRFTEKATGTSSVDDFAEHILRDLSDVRTCNAAARCIVTQLIRSTGEQDLETALAAADPESLQTAFRQILASSDEIAALLDGLTIQTNCLLQKMQMSTDAQGQTVVPEPAGERLPMDSLRPPD